MLHTTLDPRSYMQPIFLYATSGDGIMKLKSVLFVRGQANAPSLASAA